jgi:hypothetical protein
LPEIRFLQKSETLARNGCGYSRQIVASPFEVVDWQDAGSWLLLKNTADS